MLVIVVSDNKRAEEKEEREQANEAKKFLAFSLLELGENDDGCQCKAREYQRAAH